MDILETAKQRLNVVYIALKESLKGVHLGKTQADDIDVATTYYDSNVRNISPRKIADLLKSADEGDIAGAGTNKFYAGIHNFGEKTRPHIIRPKNKKILHFGSRFAKK